MEKSFIIFNTKINPGTVYITKNIQDDATKETLQYVHIGIENTNDNTENIKKGLESFVDYLEGSELMHNIYINCNVDNFSDIWKTFQKSLNDNHIDSRVFFLEN